MISSAVSSLPVSRVARRSMGDMMFRYEAVQGFSVMGPHAASCSRAHLIRPRSAKNLKRNLVSPPGSGRVWPVCPMHCLAPNLGLQSFRRKHPRPAAPKGVGKHVPHVSPVAHRDRLEHPAHRHSRGARRLANAPVERGRTVSHYARRVAGRRHRRQALFVWRIHRGSGRIESVNVYDPASDSWTPKKDMPTRLTHLNPAIDGNTIWFAGGFKGKHPGPVIAEVWKYDVAADAWTAGPPLPEPRQRRPGSGRTRTALLRRLQDRSRHDRRRSLEPVARRRSTLAAGSRPARPARPRGCGGAGWQALCTGRRSRARPHADRREILSPLRSRHENVERDRQPSRWTQPF